MKKIWALDTSKVIDLLMDFDPYQPFDSPYRYGDNPRTMTYISEEKAEELIGEKIDESVILKLFKEQEKKEKKK